MDENNQKITCDNCGFSVSLYRRLGDPDPLIEHRKTCPSKEVIYLKKEIARLKKLLKQRD